MQISDTDLRQQILEIFEKSRKEPGAAYDEQRFLNYLIEPPARHGEIKSSFAGNRRFVRFIDHVQAEFAVYFSKKDWDTNFSVDQFVQRIQELRDKPNGSIRSLQNAMAHSDIAAVILINVLLFAFAAICRNVFWLFSVALFAWLSVNCYLIWFYRRERRRLKSLLVRISDLKAAQPGHS